jgi:hypothetical protein
MLIRAATGARIPCNLIMIPGDTIAKSVGGPLDAYCQGRTWGTILIHQSMESVPICDIEPNQIPKWEDWAAPRNNSKLKWDSIRANFAWKEEDRRTVAGQDRSSTVPSVVCSKDQASVKYV